MDLKIDDLLEKVRRGDASDLARYLRRMRGRMFAGADVAPSFGLCPTISAKRTSLR